MGPLPSPSSLPSLPSRPALPRAPRPSFPSPAGVAAVLRSVARVPRPSASSVVDAASRLGARLRPSAATVDATLAFAALGTGVGVVATAAYTAANAVLPLALPRGLVETLTP